MAAKVADSLTSTVTLNDGIEMPLFGLGVWRCHPGKEAENAVSTALKHGYIMIDTADFYQNEEDVGRAIRNSGIPRDQLFVVSKLWKTGHGYEEAKKAVQKSLNKLDIGYIDLYLIHTPRGGRLVDTYKALVEFKDTGKIKSVGVSNFGVQHLEGLKDAGLPPPSVNQIELHVWQHMQHIVDYCRANNITVMGYAPLAKAQRMDDPFIRQLAEKYNKSYGQILIKWSVQNGYITIPKSGKEERIMENALVFDWELDKEDMEAVKQLEQWHCAWNPTNDDWAG